MKKKTKGRKEELRGSLPAEKDLKRRLKNAKYHRSEKKKVPRVAVNMCQINKMFERKRRGERGHTKTLMILPKEGNGSNTDQTIK